MRFIDNLFKDRTLTDNYPIRSIILPSYSDIDKQSQRIPYTSEVRIEKNNIQSSWRLWIKSALFLLKSDLGINKNYQEIR